MNLDDLKTEWRNEVQRVSPPVELQFGRIRLESAKFHSSIQFGNFCTVFAFLGVSLIEVFVQWVSLEGAGWMSKLGAVAWVLFTLWVIWVLRKALKVDRADDWTLRSRLEIEIARVEKQRDLWSRVGAWYPIPMMGAVVLSTLGGNHDKSGSYVPDHTLWTIYAVHAGLFGFVYWLCRHETKRKVDPLLASLRGIYAELVGG